MRRVLLIVAGIIIVIAVGQSLHVLPQIKLENYLKLPTPSQKLFTPSDQKELVVYQESIVTRVIESAIPSVVTVGIDKTIQSADTLQFNPANPFAPIERVPGTTQKVEQNIGSGFIISASGLVITNKHVVGDTSAGYSVLTNDKKKYKVSKIYRDPLNDLAILKIDAEGLRPLALGNSSVLKLGQMAIAIGTPLGDFTNTVTVGIVSGLGRGISAGSPLAGHVEKLDNVIQTDAAINPGNSGGPLLNSAGQVIGINTAIASGGQNIGFAIPVNIISELINDFNKRGGSFDRPYIGLRYQMLDRKTALANKVVEGAYILEVIKGSPAEKAGIQNEDIITELDGQKVKGDDDQALVRLILNKKIGDSVDLKLWRNGEFKNTQLKLVASSQ